jgi:hypothetical protein
VKVLLSLTLFAFSIAPVMAAKCPTNQGKNEDALVKIEQSWAAALEVRDADGVGCILASEFQDIDPKGQLHNRAETLTQVMSRRTGKHTLSELVPHVFGDTGYIRGLATLRDADGKVVARARFTDFYVFRDHRWQAVSGQETLIPAEAAE